VHLLRANTSPWLRSETASQAGLSGRQPQRSLSAVKTSSRHRSIRELDQNWRHLTMSKLPKHL
jgi:hypothetical protein